VRQRLHLRCHVALCYHVVGSRRYPVPQTQPMLRDLSPVERVVTVEQLITVLCQYPPARRVVVPGQEFGLSDVGDVQSRRFSSYYGADAAWGNWIPHLLRRAGLHREQCVVIGARPSSSRRRRRDLADPAETVT
jgi:hypothetical protein